jgi:hypothetical protein
MELPETFQVGCPSDNILSNLAANSLSFGDDILNFSDRGQLRAKPLLK